MPERTPNSMPKACDACRSRKLKCSNRGLTRALLLPICDNCVRAGIACVSSERARRRPRSGKIVDALRSDSNSIAAGQTPRSLHVDGEHLTSWPGIDLQGLTTPGQTPLPGMTPAPSSTSTSDSSNRPSPSASSSTTNIPSFLPMQPQQPNNLALEHTTQGFSFFMNTIYATWPVINYDDFTRRLHEGHDTWDLDFGILGHALDLLHETYVHLFAPTDSGTAKIMQRLAIINQLRCTYDYAETATADTVIVSFTMFVACIVMGKDQRALLYLSEATRLADFAFGRAARSHNRIEVMRTQRLKALLYITATATALLSSDASWRMDVPSSLNIESLTSWYGDADIEEADTPEEGEAVPQEQQPRVDPTKDIRDLDRFAVRQLQLMTRMYMMAGARSSSTPTFLLTEDDVTKTISSVPLPGSPTVRIMIADLSITQLWFSCDRRATEARGTGSNDDRPAAVEEVDDTNRQDLPENIGRKALAWARSLSSSELRAVGLGKMVDIVENMVHRSQSRQGSNSAAEVAMLADDLMAAIGTADYELRYSAAMAQCAALLRQQMASSNNATMDFNEGVNMRLFVGQTLYQEGPEMK